jgi:hypothetical protein
MTLIKRNNSVPAWTNLFDDFLVTIPNKPYFEVFEKSGTLWQKSYV